MRRYSIIKQHRHETGIYLGATFFALATVVAQVRSEPKVGGEEGAAVRPFIKFYILGWNIGFCGD